MQGVWAASEELDCGMVYYKVTWCLVSSSPNLLMSNLSTLFQGSFYETLIVCNYAVAGNLLGSAMYEAGSACSSCPARTSLLQGVISQL